MLTGDSPAQYVYQFALNGSRLGFYEPLRIQINQLAGYSASQVTLWTSVMAGATSGVIGGTVHAHCVTPGVLTTG